MQCAPEISLGVYYVLSPLTDLYLIHSHDLFTASQHYSSLVVIFPFQISRINRPVRSGIRIKGIRRTRRRLNGLIRRLLLMISKTTSNRMSRILNGLTTLKVTGRSCRLSLVASVLTDADTDVVDTSYSGINIPTVVSHADGAGFDTTAVDRDRNADQWILVHCPSSGRSSNFSRPS